MPRSYPAPNGDATITYGEVGDVTGTAETPALDPPNPPAQPRVELDYTLCQQHDGAACIKIVGAKQPLAAAQAVRLGQELIALGTYVGEQRSLLGSDE
jgi:hypothetical protein